MHKSICVNRHLELLLLAFVCGFTRVASQSQSQMRIPPRDIKMIQNIQSTPWGASEVFIIPEHKCKNYIITCTATGTPTPTYEWRFNDAPLSSSQYVEVFPNGTLLLKEFAARDNNGYYQCLASNELGVSTSTKNYIVREKTPSPNPSEDPASFTKFEGEPFSFQCAKTQPTFPEYFKRWYFKQDTHEIKLDERKGTDSNGTLWFSYLSEEDSNDYICGLAPLVAESGGVIQYYNMITLKVDRKSKTPFWPSLQFKTGGGHAKAFISRNASLECFFSGNPVANMTWKDSSNRVITGDGRKYVFDLWKRRLVITDVKDEDEGTFYCTASNGFDESSESIFLNVTSAPYKVAGQGLTNLIAPDRTDVTLRCQAKAANREGLDTPVWFRNGVSLRRENVPDPYRYSFSADYTQLFIRNISRSGDTASFQCNVSNSEGSTFYEGSLRVIESIVIKKQPNQVIELTGDDVIDISVIATGDSCCPINIRWFFNDQLLTLDELQTRPFVQDVNTGTLLFNTTDVPESVIDSRLGQYRVNVTSPYQILEVRFTISRKGARPVESAGVGFELWWLAIILGVLAIIIAIIIIVCCVKRNYPRQTYQLEKTELKHHLNPQEELLDQSFQEI